MMIEQAQRDKVCSIARTYLGTPYHPMGRVKGAGIDCAMLLAEVYEEAGLTPHVTVDYYPPDFALHQNDTRYLDIILRYAHKVDSGDSGDIAVYKFGHIGSHAAIILEKPLVIHAYRGLGVVYGSLNDPKLLKRFIGYYSLWGKI